MFSAKHRRTVSDYPDSALLQGDILSQVIIIPNNNPPLAKFVHHVEDSGYEEGDILLPARYNTLH